MNLLLFIIAYTLFLPLTIANYFLLLCRGCAKGYFRSSAINLDRYANREFRTLWNATLRKPEGYPFGNEQETISSALGKNQRNNTLTKTGKALSWFLDKLDKNHSVNSITEVKTYDKERENP